MHIEVLLRVDIFRCIIQSVVGPFTVNKDNLTLRKTNQNGEVILKAAKRTHIGPCFDICADYVTLSGLSIIGQNSKPGKATAALNINGHHVNIADCVILGENTFGIEINNKRDVLVERCRIQVDQSCIKLNFSNGTTISKCSVSSGTDGIWLYHATNTTIVETTATDCLQAGLYFQSAPSSLKDIRAINCGIGIVFENPKKARGIKELSQADRIALQKIGHVATGLTVQSSTTCGIKVGPDVRVVLTNCVSDSNANADIVFERSDRPGPKEDPSMLIGCQVDVILDEDGRLGRDVPDGHVGLASYVRDSDGCPETDLGSKPRRLSCDESYKKREAKGETEQALARDELHTAALVLPALMQVSIHVSQAEGRAGANPGSLQGRIRLRRDHSNARVRRPKCCDQ